MKDEGFMPGARPETFILHPSCFILSFSDMDHSPRLARMAWGRAVDRAYSLASGTSSFPLRMSGLSADLSWLFQTSETTFSFMPRP